MKLMIDDANIENIVHLMKYYPIDGVTTNPSILAKNGGNPYEVLQEIQKIIGETRELHIQILSHNADEIVKEAQKIRGKFGGNVYVKIPSIPEGLKAMEAVVEEGIHVTATAVYTPMQAFLAGKAGASYVAPYVNRIDNLGADGIKTTKEIYEIFKKNEMNTKVLAASFKNTQQVLELCKYGIDAVTVGRDVMIGFLKNENVDHAIAVFTRDFENAFGQGKTMLNS